VGYDVRIDEEALLLNMNGWYALVVRFDEAVLVLTAWPSESGSSCVIC
jgi:hypothetical protein